MLDFASADQPYLPGEQSLHESTSLLAVHLPPAHAVQVVAPVEVPVSVIEPAAHAAQSVSALEPDAVTNVAAGQSVHAATFEAVEYLPPAHAVQVVAPVEVPVSVIEPAAHAAQSVSALEPDAATNVAAGQSVHAATFEAVEYLPPAHIVHESAPPVVWPVL
jgi:hypothetical protein